jgi:hypothetical protein
MIRGGAQFVASLYDIPYESECLVAINARKTNAIRGKFVSETKHKIMHTKVIILSAVLATSAIITKAQQANETRIKTNPLSPMVAAERNFNLGVERTLQGEKNTLGAQVSAGYIFGWNIFDNGSNNSTAAQVHGIVSTAEFRVYGKQGLYFGPYIQFKNIQADYRLKVKYNPSTSTTTYNVSMQSQKRTSSAGIVGGYNKYLTKKIGFEVYTGLGISNKKLQDNGVTVEDFEAIDNQDFNLLIERTGRYPQFFITYKLFYKL